MCLLPPQLTFLISGNIAVDDTVKLTLPHYTFSSTLSTPALLGCGTTTYTVTGADSGLATAALTFTAAAAVMPAGTSCTITVASGVTVRPPSFSGDAASASKEAMNNLASYTVGMTLVSGNILTVAIGNSPAVMDAAVTYSSATFSPGVAGVSNSLELVFMSSVPLEVGDKIQFTVPSLTLSTLAGIGKQNCGTAAFSVTEANSGASGASITMILTSGNMFEARPCTVTIGSGVTTPAAGQAANLATRTVQVNL